MNNIFNNPRFYLEQIRNVRVPKELQKSITGKSMITVWLTKLCPANCKHCFSKSNMHMKSDLKEKYHFSNYGVQQLIRFINESNNSYVMMSGGGEPMVHKYAVNEIVRNAKTERIVIVTNGIWAKNYENAELTIHELYDSYKSRNDNAEVIVRLSVDEFHSNSLGNDLIVNIINVFKRNYSKERNFRLLIHTMKSDSTIKAISKDLSNSEIITFDEPPKSDNNNIIKIMPQKAILKIDEYEIEIGYAKLFYPTLKPDLTTFNENTQKALNVFDEDMSVSEFGNPSIVQNTNGSYGLDFWIEYNGNVTTWGNQLNDSLYNIYTDSYKDVYNGTFENIISYSFIDKGYYYRENIISEVNPKAVLRSKVMNLRNYSSASILEEDSTKLYYAIRVIQDYLNEGILDKSTLNLLPADLINVINMKKQEIMRLYTESNYDIILQSLSKDMDKDEWDTLFLLLKLGHYQYHSKNLSTAIKKYNELFFCSLTSLDSIEDSDDIRVYENVKERIAFMKKEAEKFCFLLH